MKDLVCKVCGYVINPIELKIDYNKEEEKPIQSTDDLPDDWVCPKCGIDKSNLEELHKV